MKNLKDIEKTSINSYGQTGFSTFKSLINTTTHEQGSQINKKTEKIVTALYMVTEYIIEGEVLRGKLRSVGADLLSGIYTISHMPPVDNYNRISAPRSCIYELISFITIADTIGLVSEMNAAVLVRELKNLIKDIEQQYPENKRFTFSLDDDMFNVESPFDKGQIIKDRKADNFHSPSLNQIGDRIQSKSVSTVDLKIQRKESIISFLKDKKVDVSIKDISYAVPDCSEKTIQRELNSLVLSGKIKKTGAKRWSRYQIA